MSFAVPATPGQGSGSASYAVAPTPSASGVVSSIGLYNDKAAADKAEGSSAEAVKQNATPVGVPEITAVQGIVPTLQ